jgi:ferredoxin-NADP reductase
MASVIVDELVRPMLVQQEIWESEGILSLVLVDPDGRDLPTWEPGAHIDVVLPSGLVRQYSLCSDYKDRQHYRIGVLLDPESRGGSKEIHETQLVGKLLNVRGPRNHFELLDAPHYVFLAGGIGITPMMPMIERAEELGIPWRLLYGGRSIKTMSYVPELLGRTGGTVELIPEDEKGYPDLDAAIASVGDGLMYSCGPPGLLNALEAKAATTLAPGTLHIERFVAGETVEYDEGDNTAFEVELRKTGAVVSVPPDKTMLHAILEALPYFMYACEEGYCGTCLATVLDGVPDNRDSCLSDAEREEGKVVITCVSRSKTPRIVLDL